MGWWSFAYHDSSLVYCTTITKCIHIITTKYPKPFISCQYTPTSLRWKTLQLERVKTFNYRSPIIHKRRSKKKDKSESISLDGVTWPTSFIKSIMTGRVPMPVDQTDIPYGTLISPVDGFVIVMALSETFTTRKFVFTSMPSLVNFSSANWVILLSNLDNKIPKQWRQNEKKERHTAVYEQQIKKYKTGKL